MSRWKIAVLISFCCVALVEAQTEVPLWKGDMPGVGAQQPEERLPDQGDDVQRLTHVSQPALRLYLVDEAKQATPFVIICPGGGYRILAMDKEGTEIAEWLNSRGLSAAVLKYRCPDNRRGALEDAKQAIRLARQHAEAWNIERNSIGMLGFSAGGHLTAACSNSEVRPAFSVLVYPAYLDQSNSIDLVEEITVDAKTPPAFIVQTRDDQRYYRSALAYTTALDAAGVDVECHLFAKGGHGYGLRDQGHPVSQWPKLCEDWLQEMGFLPSR